MEPISLNNHNLNTQIINNVKPFLNNTELEKFPSPLEGRSSDRIRIVESHKVIVRISTAPEELRNFEMRINKMVLAHEIITKNKFEYLKIPKASLIGDYLVEKLLPCIRGSLMSTMAYYVQNHHFFDSAVVEFTELIIQTTFDDIVGCNEWMQSNFSNKIPRYDNIKIYESCKNGKIKYRIGLIDLENFEAKEKNQSELKAARDAVILFPFQYDLILATCQKRKVFHIEDIKMVDFCRARALKNIENSFGKHFAFIQESRLLKVDPFAEFLNSIDAQHNLIQEISKLILEKHEEVFASPYVVNFESTHTIIYLKMLGRKPQEMVEYCEKNIFFPNLKEITSRMKQIIEETKNDSPDKNYEMLTERIISWVMIPPKESLEYLDKFGKKHKVSVRKLRAHEVDQSLIKPLDPLICDAIIKLELDVTEYDLHIKRVMMDLFKKKGFIAQAFHDVDHSTIFF